jgi:hypothetical protein
MLADKLVAVVLQVKDGRTRTPMKREREKKKNELNEYFRMPLEAPPGALSHFLLAGCLWFSSSSLLLWL